MRTHYSRGARAADKVVERPCNDTRSQQGVLCRSPTRSSREQSENLSYAVIAYDKSHVPPPSPTMKCKYVSRLQLKEAHYTLQQNNGSRLQACGPLWKEQTMTFIGRSSSFSKTLINTKGVCKSGDGGWGSYLSHNLTFLQLLVQQPADIKAVTEERRGKRRRIRRVSNALF